MAHLTVQIVTPDGLVYDHHASFVSVRTLDGEMGILPRHENMIAPDKEVQVSLLFFIINNTSSSQTNILAQLMDFFTSNGNLEALSKLDSEDKLYQYITETIS